MSEKIGLIAGKSKFPLIFAQSARKQGIEVVAAAHRGETDPDLEGLVSDLEWVSVGQLGRIIKFFQKAGVTRAVMAGGITKGRLFTHLRPDLRALKLLSRMKHVGDDGILRGVAAELEGEGITIVSPAPYLTDLLAPAGVLSRRRPSAEQMRDIDFGADIAKEIGRLDIGQCVVVRRQAVLAVEAIDGTDATIRRGGLLAGEKAVVVKVSKPNQDLRFDVPAVGLGTIQVMQEVKASALALEAGKTLIFERTEMLQLADRLRIAVIGLTFDRFSCSQK
ncbi:MAG TPA: UDP-2,3-diacylglucosamine diphosphatase LpxI [Thermodesulfobacteriota bacterium]|nr:UDP-2,3-diacylglucosamine diphosphatase LpxI [Thermodesulfobacteriota bacterium]